MLPLGFSLASVGIKASGRTTILRLNYRNTAEVLGFAYRFARQYLDVRDADNDGVPLVEPDSAGRHGPAPVVRILRDFDEESRFVARALRRFHTRDGIPWCDMCVTFHAHWMTDSIVGACRAHDVPVVALTDRNRKLAFKQTDDCVKLMTMHSSKGLEFPVVIVAGVGRLGREAERVAEDAKLLYVAMTRSTERLLVTGDRESDFLTALQAADGYVHTSSDAG